MPLFSLLQIGASSSRTTSLKFILKNWDKFDAQSLKTHIWSSSVILNGHSILWKMGNVDLLKGFNYNTVLQLDRFCKKQEKWVEVTYMFLFISLWDMPGLCPKSTDLGVKPSAPSSSLTLPLDLGLAIEQAENQDTFPGRVASVLVEIQTVPIQVKLSKRSNKYIEAFTGLTLWAYLEVNVLGQILTPDSRAWVLAEATAFGDKWLECETRGNREHEIALLPQFISVAQSCPTLCDPMFHCLPSCSAGQTLQAVLKLFLPHQKNLFVYVQFSRSVVSDSLRPHELQQARPPCPSPTPAVHTPKYMFTHIIYINT